MSIKLYYYLTLLISFLLAYISYRQFFPFEDAAILFRYSANLADFGNIGFNQGEISEGATDFGWMLILSVFSVFGLPEYYGALFMNFFVFSLVLLHPILGFWMRVAWIFGILMLPQFYSGLGGFSVIFCGLLLMLITFEAFHNGNISKVVIIGFLLTFLRPDMILFVAPIIVYIFVKAQFQFQMREVFTIISLIIFGLLYVFWRVFYFGEYFPLPFLVKSDGTRDLMIWFQSSLNMLIYPYILLVFVVFVFDRSMLRPYLFTTFFALLFLCSMRLDQNIGNRFFGPFVFVALGLLFSKTNKLSDRRTPLFLISICLASLIGSKDLGPRAFFDVVDSKFDRDHELGLALKEYPNIKLLVTEAGRIPYYSELYTIDVWGLNTPKYSRYPFNYQDIVDEDWDIGVFHCPIDWFGGTQIESEKLTLTDERNWGEMCKRLALATDELDGVELYAYQYRRPGSLRQSVQSLLGRKHVNCFRHDIIAVRDTSFPLSEILPNLPLRVLKVSSHDWDEVCV